MPDTLKVGMLGAGFSARAHANAIDRLPMFFPDAPATEREVLVGWPSDELDAMAGRLGFERASTSWESELPDIDVLYNLSRNVTHAEPTIAALEADTHVLCEKPLAHTLTAADRMREAANASNARAAVGFNYRFVPALQYARGLIESGELGEIHHARGRYLQDVGLDSEERWTWRHDREQAGAGALADLGAHTIDLCRYLVGEITGVSGDVDTLVTERPSAAGMDRDVTVDDKFSAQLAFKNGGKGTVEASFMSPGTKNEHAIEIDGTTGSLRFHLERLNELEVSLSGDRGFETILVTESDDPYIEHWWPPGHVIGWEHSFVHQSYEFLSAIAAGDDLEQTPVATFEDGYRTQAVMDAIQRSAEHRRWVDI